MDTSPGDESSAKLVDEIVAMCERSGLRKSSPGIAGAYTHDVHHHYESSDFEAAPLLWLIGQKVTFDYINSGERDEHGRICVPTRKAKSAFKIASIFPRPWVVLTNQTRRVLESGQLVGLKFAEVSIEGKATPISSEPFWELRSSVVLPKMVNSVPDTVVKHESFLIYGSYGEPHYRQLDLQPLGVFDIAFTREPLGGNRDPSLIVSQRFYQHCLNNKIPLEVRPVRIDPD